MPFLFAFPPSEFDEPITSSGNFPPPTDPYDDYDPRKPEYVRTASPEEVEHTNTKLIEQQIKKLETAITRKKERQDLLGKKDKKQVVIHYEHILDEMRSSASLVNHRKMTRTRSAPDFALEQGQEKQDLKAQRQERQDFEPHPREKQAEIEWFGNQCEELAMTDEHMAEHEAPRVRPSSGASPGELLRHYSAGDREHMKMLHVVPHSVPKQQGPPTRTSRNYTHARMRSQPNPTLNLAYL